MEWQLSQGSSIQEQQHSKLYELFERDALGRTLTELFADSSELFGVAKVTNTKNYDLFSVFTKDGQNRFTFVGHLGKNGGILRDKNMDIGTVLRPHLHRSSKQCVDRYLTEIRHPFTSRVTEFTPRKLSQRPEGKKFSWLDMGLTQVHYVDPVKLSTRLEDCSIDTSRQCLADRDFLYIVYQNCQSEKLHYYSTASYQCSSWLGKDSTAIGTQIKNTTKSATKGPCLVLDGHAPRAFSLCKVPVSKKGVLGSPDYSVKLLPTNPFQQSADDLSFFAEELDFEFTSWVLSKMEAMRTREMLQSAIKDLYVHLEAEQRQQVLEFLLLVIRKFQTEENQVVQMVDLSFAIKNIPECLDSRPSILPRVLRGAGIVVTHPSPQDSDDEDMPEPQIVFQPANCQEYLKIIEFLLTLLVKGIVTNQQCETAAQLLEHEVMALLELFHTQMGCICMPWKSLNPKEEPLVTLWKKGTRTRHYLESLGLAEHIEGEQKLVRCSKDCQLLNVLAIFFKEVD